MKVINFGSINIDHVYQVEHFVQPGETLASRDYQRLLGGKGANQSIALAKAGASVQHVGLLNEADQSMKASLEQSGVDCSLINFTDTASGHAIIQVDSSGENSIILFAGANHQLSDEIIEQALSGCSAGDWVLLQNETNGIADIISKAKQRNLKVAFNPAPMTDSVKQLPLEKLDLLIVNETEAEALSGASNLTDIQKWCRAELPNTDTILTLGAKGAKLLSQNSEYQAQAFPVDAVDTTAAGDTFIGYFLWAYINDTTPEAALQNACAASAVAVTRAGAAQSIPTLAEVQHFLQQQG